MANGYGICSSQTANYSPDTLKMLNVLMDEAKITLYQRKKIQDKIVSGEPLPKRINSAQIKSQQNDNLFQMKKNYYFRKRSLEAIKNSGAFEYEYNLMPIRRVDREKEIQDFHDLMAFGKKILKDPKKEPVKRYLLTKEDRLNELAVDIKDRLEFLNKMTELGLRGQYYNSIHQEIAAKLREVKIVEKMSPEQFQALNIQV